MGDHLKRRRHELSLLQKEVVALLGVNQWTLIRWESNRKEPAIRFLARIIKFLGYDPCTEPRTLGERLLPPGGAWDFPKRRWQKLCVWTKGQSG